MIISHKHKYIFIQLDQTGSTAIGRELRNHYNGEKTLWKHARYTDFLKIAGPKEKKYFTFSGVRNPLDVIVSLYIRRKLDPTGRFAAKDKNRGVTRKDIKQYNFIKEKNADFPTFFKKFYSNQIYNEWKAGDFEKLNYIYRFENIQAEFEKILKNLEIKQIKPLPIINKTKGRKKNFTFYYTKDIQSRAKIVFGRYMKKWGYKFPEDWQDPSLYEKIFIGIPLDIKYALQKLFHFVFDAPILYKKLHKVALSNKTK